MRTVIVGGPKTGKTTRAAAVGGQIIHTDALQGAGDFSAQSAAAMAYLGSPDPITIEGVTAVRALRKWLAANPQGKPCDVVVHLSKAKQPLSRGQHTLAKGCDTVFREIEADLRTRGVVIEEE